MPARYGFKDMRSLVGYLAYHHLRGSRAPKAIPRGRGQQRRLTKVTPLSDAQRGRLFEDLRRGGKSVAQLSEEYGLSRARVYQLIAANRLPLPTQIAA